MRHLMNVGRLAGRLRLPNYGAKRLYADQPSTDLLESATIRPELLR